MPVVAPAPPARTASGLVPSWIGSRVFDVAGVDMGRVADVLFDAHGSAPGWLLLCLPRLEDSYVFAPARGLRHRVDGVQLACGRELALSAPHADAPPDSLAKRHAMALALHYGVRCGAGPWHGVLEPTLIGAGGRVPASRPV